MSDDKYFAAVCPTCSGTFKARESQKGKSGPCPLCQAVITVAAEPAKPSFMDRVANISSALNTPLPVKDVTPPTPADAVTSEKTPEAFREFVASELTSYREDLKYRRRRSVTLGWVMLVISLCMAYGGAMAEQAGHPREAVYSVFAGWMFFTGIGRIISD